MVNPMKQQRKKPKHGKEAPIALARYTREQWMLLKQVATDAGTLPETFEKWRADTDNAYRILLQSGYVVQFVEVEVTELIKWCKSRSRPLDGEARSDYIAEKLEDFRHRRG